MSAHEKTGRRSLLYSGWHRERGLRERYGFTPRQAWSLGVIDIDSCEFCRHCFDPLALVETQESYRPPKPAPVMSRLAARAGIPAYSVSIVPGAEQDSDPIALFMLRRLHPPTEHMDVFTGAEYAAWLLSLRADHECKARPAAGGAR